MLFRSDQYLHGDFKICFSLVYSIQDISGATILNKVGRYYELHSQQDEIFITLQEPRIGSYNLSCGPEGLFILDKNENKIDCKIIPLQFENPIDKIIYSDEQEKNFVPIIPFPQKLSLQKKTVQLNSLEFKIPSGEITNLNLIKHIVSKNKSIILSTGMANMDEVGFTINFLIDHGCNKKNIIVLHCNK